MIVGLSAENPFGGGYFYAELQLPATPQQIKDFKQRARFTGTSGFADVEVLSAPYLERLEYMRMDTTSAEELNYLAQRIDEMPDDELVIFQALFQKRYVDTMEADEFISVKDLINMTYGLDEVMIASKDYVLPEVYDGEHLPDTEHENAVFRLKIADESGAAAQIFLPADYEKIRQFTGSSVERYRLLELDSANPHISKEMCAGMDSIGTLNQIADRYTSMSNADQITFKAVLDAENITELDEILQAADRLDEYELSYFAGDAASFYKDYIAKYLDTRFDTKWLDTLPVADEGKHLIERLGAAVTDYGVLSARGGHLYEIVSYDEPGEEEEFSDTDTEQSEGEQQIGGISL